MCSARSANVSWLYCTPPGLAGSTNGTLSVPSANDSNHPSAVIVRFGRFRAASDGSPLLHWSGSLTPRGPVSPAASALIASVHAAWRRSAPGASGAAAASPSGGADPSGVSSRPPGRDPTAPCSAPTPGDPIPSCSARGWPASVVSAALLALDDNVRNQVLPAPSGRHLPPVAQAACDPPALSVPCRCASAP
eukprot:6177005-Pleurochrysis_carterae.AAC.1